MTDSPSNIHECAVMSTSSISSTHVDKARKPKAIGESDSDNRLSRTVISRAVDAAGAGRRLGQLGPETRISAVDAIGIASHKRRGHS